MTTALTGRWAADVLAGVPDYVRHSPLMRAGGFDVVEGLLDRGLGAALAREAMALRPRAAENRAECDDGEEVRGGSPARRLMSVEGGEVQDALYRCAGMSQFVGSLTGEPMRPTGVRGTFSYYDRGGDHLALHRDIDACEVAVISCLRDTGGTSTRGGGHLCLYPTRVAEPLSAIRASPARGAVVCPLAVGQTIVLLGGVVPHVVLPIAAGRQRVVSILCYQRACRNE